MGRGVARVTQVLAVALLAGATAAHAQVPITIDDVRVPEQSGGFWSLVPQVWVRLPGPAPATITVQWTIVPGSATVIPGNDYSTGATTGLITFNIGEDSKPVPGLLINGDTIDEWSPTLRQDEVFFIELSNPSANATLQKSRGTITLIDDDRVMPGVQFLAALSTGDAANGYNKLHWRQPGAQVAPNDVFIRWNTGPSCVPPPTIGSALSGIGSGQGYYVANFGFTMLGAGKVHTWPHAGLTIGLKHCYSVFAMYGGSPTSQVAQIMATPFNGSGTIAWRYHTGAASVVPPTIGADGVYTVDNLGVVHAMQRGPSGGYWPPSWNPVAVGKPTQNRSAAVPLSSGWRLFLGTDGGGIHAVDGLYGHVIWSRSSAFGTALQSLGGAQAQPAGLFKAWGGNNDMLLIGTNNGVGSNAFFGLDPNNGANLASYTSAAIGNVTGMAVVDYAANRAYFGTSDPSATLFALDLGPVGAPALSPSPPAWNPKPMGTGTSSAPVLRNGTLYLGDSVGEVHTLRLSDGLSYACPTSDGPVKGFIWPDRRDDRLYFSTNGKVHGYRDPGGPLIPLWSTDVTTPSIVLQKPGSDYLYVGDGNGRLVQIDVTNPPGAVALLLEAPGVQIGAPSLDRGWDLVIVGSSTGTIHAVRVPF